MRSSDFIFEKRQGQRHAAADIDAFIRGAVSGEVPSYQVSAWLMAVYFQGMDAEETAALTQSMLASGRRFDFPGLGTALVDKHSSGGVGDKTSLILAPVAAACGLFDPMMSGRSLGHTGGTLDKLDSIPGYRSLLSPGEFESVLNRCGFAMTGQTEDVVPADRLLYGLRDVTATVESIPLITASILSKKAAEGTQSLIMDVKCGSGAFMKDRAQARGLAASLLSTWKAMGRRMVAVLSDMSEPLGRAVGNFLEVEEALDFLEGRVESDLGYLTRRLGAWMLVAGAKAADVGAGEALFDKAISSGRALKAFLANVEAQGGDVDRLMAMRGAARAPLEAVVQAKAPGFLGPVDAFEIGMASVYLGAGRAKAGDAVYPDVGLLLEARSGQAVEKGQALCRLYARDQASLDAALARARPCFRVQSDQPPPRPAESIILEESLAL